MQLHLAVYIGLVALSAGLTSWVGIRLLLLARRTRRIPEFGVGIALFAWAALSQPAALVLGPMSDQVTHSFHEFSYRLYWLAWLIAFVGLAVFSRQVFGRSPRLRRLIFWLAWTPAACAYPFILYNGVGSTYPEAVFNTTCAIVFGWAGVESLRYWLMLRRRLIIGLADPVTTNRFFLWGSCCAGTSVLSIWVFFLTLSGQGLGSGSVPSELIVTVGGTVNAFIWIFTFAPPKTYVHWLAVGE